MSDKTKDSLFNSFPPNSKLDWLKKLETELKGGNISELYTKLDENIIVNPFVNKDDISTSHYPFTRSKANNSWSIGTSIHLKNDPTNTNKALLKLLDMGVTAPELVLKNEIDRNTLESLFKGVKHEFMETYISLQENACNQASINQLADYISTIHSDGQFFLAYENSNLSHSSQYDLLIPLNKSKKLRFISFGQAIKLNEALSVTGKLYDVCKQLIDCLNESQSLNISKELVISSCYFNLLIGPKYLSEIAGVRALKILWRNILKAFKLVESDPHIVARVQNIKSDVHPLIQVASITSSAILGGVDSIFIHTDNESKKIEKAGLDIKLQHILNYESQLSCVSDPIAGSFFIEKLSQQIAEKVWQKLTL